MLFEISRRTDTVIPNLVTGHVKSTPSCRESTEHVVALMVDKMHLHCSAAVFNLRRPRLLSFIFILHFLKTKINAIKFDLEFSKLLCSLLTRGGKSIGTWEPSSQKFCGWRYQQKVSQQMFEALKQV